MTSLAYGMQCCESKATSCGMVTGTHMDVRKAYDTVWRDGLMYKLWDKGVRGQMWSYVDALYSRSIRQVRVGAALSDVVEMGVAQPGRYLVVYSYYTISNYVDDLTDAYQDATPGIPLPQQDTAAGAAPRVHTLPVC
jgi:hypothetical protein